MQATKKTVKIIVNYQYDNIANSMDELKILNIYERIFLSKAKFMFKISKICPNLKCKSNVFLFGLLMKRFSL